MDYQTQIPIQKSGRNLETACGLMSQPTRQVSKILNRILGQT